MGIRVRASVNMQGGLSAGQIAMVDPERPNIKRYLDAGYLVPLQPWEEGYVEADPAAVSIHRPVLENATEDARTDGDSAEEGDVEDGVPAVDEV